MQEIAQSVQTSPSTQQMQPEVSVVVVCYNQAVFLFDSIQSVLDQTYRNFEIVIVDDGSIDNTAEVTRGFREARYIHQPNRGLASARNTGSAVCQGRYIVFLDADDRLL